MTARSSLRRLAPGAGRGSLRGMEASEAVALIRGGIVGPGGTWADLGAGSGTFTRALAELIGEAGVVHAVDQHGGRLPTTGRGARIVPLVADFTGPLPLADLDGVVMANALHFVADPGPALARIVELLKPGGAFILVEYDQTRGSRWVPYPLTPRSFTALARGAGLSEPREIGRQRSRYGPTDIYAAVAFRLG